MNIQSLLFWFQKEKRDLPWRNTRDPYAIWISEVMLQQTQVTTVIPYYVQWMTHYPTVEILSKASLEEVIKSWEGLGYYSRARHIHEAAKYFVQHFKGVIPDDEEALRKVKGFGPYTIGALLSFAFHKKACAIDGNVTRVLTRFFGISEEITKVSTQKTIQKLNHSLLPDDEPWVVMEALIELGALTCQKKAQCDLCPLKKDCQAFQAGTTDHIPFREKRKSIETLRRAVFVIRSEDGHLLLKKETGKKVMSDLYEFPYTDMISNDKLVQHIKKNLRVPVIFKHSLPQEKHHFTRFRAFLFPFLFEAQQKSCLEGYQWVPMSEVIHLPFSSGHRRILLNWLR